MLSRLLREAVTHELAKMDAMAETLNEKQVYGIDVEARDGHSNECRVNERRPSSPSTQRDFCDQTRGAL